MNDTKSTTEAKETVKPQTVGSPVYVPKEPNRSYQGQGGPRGPRQSGGKQGGPRGQGGRGGDRRAPRTPSEYDQKILNIRRVARVVAGGRRFTFSVAIVIGNRKGSVGVGIAKAGDTTLAIDKATRVAKKHLVKPVLTKEKSIAHEVLEKYSSAIVMLRPAKGKGLVAGSAVRSVLELCGVTDTTAKILSPSKNKLNIAQATVKALQKLK